MKENQGNGVKKTLWIAVGALSTAVVCAVIIGASGGIGGRGMRTAAELDGLADTVVERTELDHIRTEEEQGFLRDLEEGRRALEALRRICSPILSGQTGSYRDNSEAISALDRILGE